MNAPPDKHDDDHDDDMPEHYDPAAAWDTATPHPGSELPAQPASKPALAIDAPHDPTSPQTKFSRGDQKEIGDRLLSVLKQRGPRPVFAEGALWAYDPTSGMWRAADGDSLTCIVGDMAGAPVGTGKNLTPLKIQNPVVTGAIKLACASAANKAFFADAPKGHVAFTNGTVMVEGGTVNLLQHSPDHRARVGYNFAHERREPKRFLQFLGEVFRDDTDKAEKIAFIQEFFGLAILGLGTAFQKCLVAIGEGSNGKGVLLEIVTRCMPPGTTCALSIHDFASRFRPAQLVGKHLNACGELPAADLESSEAFKGIIAGDVLTVEQKNQPAFTTKLCASHFFSCNKFPATRDQSHAFWRRPIVVSFNRIFGADDTILNLAEKILADELPALVSWFLEGAARAWARRSYTTVPSSADGIAEWQMSTDQTLQFLEAETEAVESDDTDHWARASALYARYRDWARDNGHPLMNSTNFGSRLARHRTRKHTADGNRYRVRLKGLLKGSEGGAFSRFS
jgi:P4 family phage/plasmid primase-like protien